MTLDVNVRGCGARYDRNVHRHYVNEGRNESAHGGGPLSERISEMTHANVNGHDCVRGYGNGHPVGRVSVTH